MNWLYVMSIPLTEDVLLLLFTLLLPVILNSNLRQ